MSCSSITTEFGDSEIGHATCNLTKTNWNPVKQNTPYVMVDVNGKHIELTLSEFAAVYQAMDIFNKALVR